MQGVLRDEKRKNRGAIAGLEQEANRDEHTHDNGKDFVNSDIDWERTHLNKHYIRTDNWNKALDKLYKEYGVKPRKDSVLGFDTVYSASPEYFVQRENETLQEYETRIDEFFKDCLKHHIDSKCQGDEKRVLNAVLHRDEKTYHLQVFTASIWYDEKKEKYCLSAKSIFGNKTDMSRRQQSFYDDVLKPRGFDERKIKTELETDHKTQAQYRKEQKIKQEQEIKERQQAISQLDKEQATLSQKIDTLKEQVHSLQGELKTYHNEMSKAKQGISVLHEVNTEIDRLTRLEPKPPKKYGETKQKKNWKGEVIPRMYTVDASEHDHFIEETRFQKSDVWKLDSIEKQLKNIMNSLESLDVSLLRANLRQLEIEKNSKEQTIGKLALKIDNMVYDLQKLAVEQQDPELARAIHKIITQENTTGDSQKHEFEI
jgi:hypothetical protein